MKIYKKYSLFFNSIISGFLIWTLFFVFTPVTITESLKLKTILFIFLCYGFLIFGFLIFNYNIKKYNLEIKKIKTKWLYIIYAIILLSFLIRWIELFYFREVSFDFDSKSNRVLSSFRNDFNLIFILASIFKSIYFFPYAYCKLGKAKVNKPYLFLSISLLFFPFIECFIYGTRKPFFEIFLIILIINIISGRLKFNFRSFIYGLFGVIMILCLSAIILFKREAENTQKAEVFYEEILTARYNDILAPTKQISAFIRDKNHSKPMRMVALIGLQTGQYITHGLFEFNHIINEEIPTTMGAYTFYPFIKYYNHLTYNNDTQTINPSPREYVYLTAFGGFFIDFKWFSLIFFLFFGAFQKFIYKKAKTNMFYKPILIYILVINVSLIIINYLRGAGIYPIVAFSLLSIFLVGLERLINEKGISS
jgi:hypothetical protein